MLKKAGAGTSAYGDRPQLNMGLHKNQSGVALKANGVAKLPTGPPSFGGNMKLPGAPGGSQQIGGSSSSSALPKGVSPLSLPAQNPQGSKDSKGSKGSKEPRERPSVDNVLQRNPNLRYSILNYADDEMKFSNLVDDYKKVLNSSLKKGKSFEQVEELVGIICTIDGSKKEL